MFQAISRQVGRLSARTSTSSSMTVLQRSTLVQRNTSAMAALANTSRNTCTMTVDLPWIKPSQPYVFYGPYQNIVWDDAQNLDAWRKENDDPLAFLDAKARQEWVDNVKNYSYINRTPCGARYGLHHTTFGYGRARRTTGPGAYHIIGELMYFPYECFVYLFYVHGWATGPRWAYNSTMSFLLIYFFYYQLASADIRGQNLKAYYYSRASPDFQRGINWEYKIVNGA